MMNPELITLLAGALGFYAFYPYIRDVIRRKTKPHVFTWGIWGLLTGIAFVAQMTENAGPGAWVTACFMLLNFFIVILALRFGEHSISRSDWIMLALALSALPLWALTKDPLWSVAMVCGIDCIAFVPTYRKSWGRPDEETLQTYALCSTSYLLSFFALETINLTTVLFPATLVGTNIAFIAMVLARRRVLAMKKA